MSCLLKVGDDGGATFDCHLDFEGDLLASVNESLLYGERIAGLDLVWHVADFRGHGDKIYVGENDTCAVRIPSDDFAVCVKPMSGPFAGGAAIERSVGFHSVE